MKPLALPSLWYGSFLTLSLAALFGLQLGAALYLPKVVPARKEVIPAK